MRLSLTVGQAAHFAHIPMTEESKTDLLEFAEKIQRDPNEDAYVYTTVTLIGQRNVLHDVRVRISKNGEDE